MGQEISMDDYESDSSLQSILQCKYRTVHVSPCMLIGFYLSPYYIATQGIPFCFTLLTCTIVKRKCHFISPPPPPLFLSLFLTPTAYSCKHFSAEKI